MYTILYFFNPDLITEMTYMLAGERFWKKPFFIILCTLFILWIILFEFILPENNFLPKPDIVLLSVPALFEDYHLTANFFTTVSAVYLPALLAYLFVFILRSFLLKRTASVQIFTGFISKLCVFFPPFLLAALFIFWFPDSLVIEYIFVFIISILWWLTEIDSKAGSSNESYSLAFKSMGADDKFININVKWNEIKPGVFRNLGRFHLHLWAVILVFEYISNYNGLGSIIHQTLTYHDLSALFLVIIIISAAIYAGSLLLKFMRNRFIFWSAE